jgi:hypothetical protein
MAVLVWTAVVFILKPGYLLLLKSRSNSGRGEEPVGLDLAWKERNYRNPDNSGGF